MTQAIGATATSSAGTINRVGATQDGRIIYQMTSPDGESQGHLSVAAKDCDKFEKSYNTIVETASAVQKFSEKYSTKESMKQLRKKTRLWALSTATVAGVGVNFFTGKFKGKYIGLKQFLAVCSATIAGYILGNLIGVKATVPSDVTKFSKATQDITKMDIKPYSGA